jgi:hypothetical protein
MQQPGGVSVLTRLHRTFGVIGWTLAVLMTPLTISSGVHYAKPWIAPTIWGVAGLFLLLWLFTFSRPARLLPLPRFHRNAAHGLVFEIPRPWHLSRTKLRREAHKLVGDLRNVENDYKWTGAIGDPQWTIVEGLPKEEALKFLEGKVRESETAIQRDLNRIRQRFWPRLQFMAEEFSHRELESSAVTVTWAGQLNSLESIKLIADRIETLAGRL